MAMTPALIKTELDHVESDGTFYRQRQDVNSKVRYTRWDGQSEDGKKHEKNIGVKPFPFEGATDTRVRMAEDIINKEVRLMMTAWKNAKLKTAGKEITDGEKATKSTTLLNWMVKTQMSPNSQDETKLEAEYRQQNGNYLTRIEWKQEWGTEQDEITVQEMQELALEIPEVAELLELIFDGGLDEEAAQILGQIRPELTDKKARKVIKELRENGIATFDVPYLRVNRPEWTALRSYRDVYYPTYVDDIQRSPWIAERKYYTEEEVREKENSAGWSKEFINRVLEYKGRVSLDQWSTQDRNKFGRLFSYEETVEDQEDLFEVYHVYYKSNGEEEDIGIYHYDMTYFDPEVQSQPAELLNYDHGLYPFVVGRRDYTERGIIQSRGVGEICQTWQGEVKIQRDASADRTSLDMIPPMLVKSHRAGTPIQFGSGVQIPVRDPSEIQPLQLPNSLQNAELIIQQTWREVNSYFGRDPEDPQGNQVYQQSLVDSWLMEQQQKLEQTFQLMQQFMPDMQANIVMGGEIVPFEFSREEIQGKYDISVQFDVRDLDQEMVKERINGWTTLKGMDSEGIVNMSPLITRIAAYIDPIGAQEIISSPQQAGQREAMKAQDVLTKIFAGIEPPPPDENTAAQLQLQVIQNELQKNPQLMQRYQQDEIYQGMINTYLEQLQFQITQKENAQIGRTGAKPFLDTLGEGGMVQ